MLSISHPTHPACPRKPHHARPWKIGLSSPTARPVTEPSQIWQNTILQERLKAAEAKRIEKERTEKYNKLKTDAKDARAKYREKVKQEDQWVYRENQSLYSTSFPRVLQGLMPKRNPTRTTRRTVLGPARKWSRIQWTVSRNLSTFNNFYILSL